MRQKKTYFLVSMVFILLALVSIHANAASPQSAKAPSRAVVNPDNISPVVLLEGSLPVIWTNDDTYPWGVNTTEKSIYNGNHGVKNSVSWISFSYNSTYQTEVSFSWKNSTSSYHTLLLYIDGVYTANTTSNSYSALRYYLPKGQHVVAFRDSIGNYTYDSQWSDVKNIKVTEIKSLESVVLADGSKPLVFKNDDTWPWIPMTGFIQNSNYGKQNTASRCSTTFTINQPSVFKFDYNNSNNSYYHLLSVAIDNKTDDDEATGKLKSWSFDNVSDYGLFSRVLDPGTYTIEWKDTVYDYTSSYPSKIKNVMLHDNWIDIELAIPGTLGVEVLYKVDVLTDVELLKVRGTINSTDWADIKKMTNLKGIDLSEARFENVPASAFSSNTKLNYCVLPNGMKSIGTSAFQGTSLTKITIPASVTDIGEKAFYQITTLDKISIADGSQLVSIGDRAFYGCSLLREFIMPNTVTSLGTYVFYTCTNLRKIHFSDALSSIPEYTCTACSSLNDLHLPINVVNINQYAFSGNYYNSNGYSATTRIKLKKIELPSTLRTIGNYAFSYCNLDSVKLPIALSSLGQYAFQYNTLKYIELPSYIGSYNYNFMNCTAVEKVVCRSATPPTISNDPFSNGRVKSEITLVVPSFAVASYKLHSYWYQFGNIIEGDDVDYWMITGPLMLTNNRRMDGVPDIDLYYGGQLTVGGNAPMPVGQMNYYAGQSGYGRLLNTCPNMTIENLTSYYSANYDTWYFLSPIHDVDLTKVKHSDTSASFVFRYYNAANRAENGTGTSWQNVNNGKLEAGKGYIFRTNKSGTMTLPADAAGIAKFVNINDVTTNLETHNSSNSANKNWNYVGNPYPCYYDIYYMDFTAPIQVWTGSTYKAYSIADDKLALKPMQSFFVQKPDAISKIVFHKEGRQVESTPNHANMAPRYAPSQNSERKLFDFAISTDTIADETRVVLNEKASLAYEIERDAAKFLSMDSEVPQLYTIDYDQTMLAINERPISDSIVCLGVFIGKPGTYTIDASRCPGEVELIDQVAKTTTDLNVESYSFEIDQPGFINDRFVLKFKNSSSSVIETKVNNTIEIHPVSGGVDIESSISTWANVYTIDGRLVANVKCSTGTTHISLPAGIYMVQVGKNAIKIIVQ